jgi:hypothetical protein
MKDLKTINNVINDMIIKKLSEYGLIAKKASNKVIIMNLPMYCSIQCDGKHLVAEFIKQTDKFGRRDTGSIIIDKMALDDIHNPNFDPTIIIANGDKLYQALASLSVLYGYIDLLNPSAARAVMKKIIVKMLDRDLTTGIEVINVIGGFIYFNVKNYLVITCGITTDNKFIVNDHNGMKEMTQDEFEILLKDKYTKQLVEINTSGA